MKYEAQVRLLSLLFSIAGLTATSLGTEAPGVCEIPGNQPSCRAYSPAWVYNWSTGYCDNLAYAGCYTHGSFRTEKECNVRCRDPVLRECAEPIKVNCASGSKKYFFDPATRQCSLYEGCYSAAPTSDGKTFTSFKDCNRTCARFIQDPCLLPQNEGIMCESGERAELGRKTWYWYNSRRGICEVLNYAGCGGNLNRFREEVDCWKVCSKHMARCNLPISGGYVCPPSNPRVRRLAYGYNPKTERCERFSYNGCGGNSNNFRTAKACWDTCAGLSKSNCVKDPGLNVDGIGIYGRFYYDRNDDKCKYTKYFTASNTNKNRFYTVTECSKECKAYYEGEKDWMEE